MASPTVETRASSTTTSNQTSHTVALPTGIVAGNLLILVIGVDAQPSITVPAGDWTIIDSVQVAACKVASWYRQADGTEGASISVTTSSTQHLAAVVLRISGAEAAATQAPEKGTAASGASANPDPPSATPTGGAKDYLWITYNVADGGRASTVAPTNYLNLQAPDSGAATDGVAVGTAERTLNASSEDPGTFTIDASDDWHAQTLVIHPVGAAATNLVIQDASHPHSAESQSLTQVHNLAVQEASHGHAADQQALTQVHELAVAGAEHDHFADNVVVEPAGELGIAGATHAHTADEVSLTQAHELQVQDANHGHNADALVLTQVHVLVVADATHAHSANNLLVTLPAIALVISDGAHTLTSDGLVLTQTHYLVVVDAHHELTDDYPFLADQKRVRYHGTVRARKPQHRFDPGRDDGR